MTIKIILQDLLDNFHAWWSRSQIKLNIYLRTYVLTMYILDMNYKCCFCTNASCRIEPPQNPTSAGCCRHRSTYIH